MYGFLGYSLAQKLRSIFNTVFERFIGTVYKISWSEFIAGIFVEKDFFVGSKKYKYLSSMSFVFGVFLGALPKIPISKNLCGLHLFPVQF